VGVDVFSDKKCTLLATSGEEIKSPILQRSNAQVVADLGNTLQIMDLTSFETFEVPKPTDKDVLDKLIMVVKLNMLDLNHKQELYVLNKQNFYLFFLFFPYFILKERSLNSYISIIYSYFISKIIDFI
jgi:translation elongation factor P/translation initiation factor 5A